MDELNRLLNKVLGSKEVNYTDGVDNLNKCRETFRKSLGEDEIKLKVFFFFSLILNKSKIPQISGL